MSKLWEFLLARAEAARTGQYTARDPHLADALMAVLAEHHARDDRDLACTGCGFTADGTPRTPMVDQCPTLRALAWAHFNHPEWRVHWTLDAQPYLTTWPPSENCFCGGADDRRNVLAHRRGTRRHCRLSKWEREHAPQHAGVS